MKFIEGKDYDVVGDCWIWKLRKAWTGYSWYGVVATNAYAHVASRAEKYGPAPNGFIHDHTCPNTLCIHPDHVQLLTRGQHNTKHKLQRGYRRRSCA